MRSTTHTCLCACAGAGGPAAGHAAPAGQGGAARRCHQATREKASGGGAGAHHTQNVIGYWH